MPPKIRVPAAFLSPAAIFLAAGAALYVAADFGSDEDLEEAVKRAYPEATRRGRERDARVVEFLTRVQDGDPKENERVQAILRGGKGSSRSTKFREQEDQYRGLQEPPKEFIKTNEAQGKEHQEGVNISTKPTKEVNRLRKWALGLDMSAREKEEAEEEEEREKNAGTGKKTKRKLRKATADAKTVPSPTSVRDDAGRGNDGVGEGDDETKPRRRWWGLW